jgi:hypothetical protein
MSHFDGLMLRPGLRIYMVRARIEVFAPRFWCQGIGAKGCKNRFGLKTHNSDIAKAPPEMGRRFGEGRK